MRISSQFSLGFLVQQITFVCIFLALIGYLRSLPPARSYDSLVLRGFVVTFIGTVIGAFLGGFFGHSQRYALGCGVLAAIGSGLLIWYLHSA
jgi:hypothetical protein